jgi:hypothetical protein
MEIIQKILVYQSSKVFFSLPFLPVNLIFINMVSPFDFFKFPSYFLLYPHDYLIFIYEPFDLEAYEEN